MEFYGIVVAIASIFLIVCLIIVGILMQNMSPDTDFPPISNPCPDNWTIQGNTCIVPEYNSNKNVGILKDEVNHGPFISATHGISNDTFSGSNFTNIKNGITSIDFNHSNWKTGGSAVCAQRTWSNQYGISWDGVSNLTGCPT